MSAVVTVASAGAATHEVLQVVLPAGSGDTLAVAVLLRDYVERHGDTPDLWDRLSTVELPGGHVEHTFLVFSRAEADPS